MRRATGLQWFGGVVGFARHDASRREAYGNGTDRCLGELFGKMLPVGQKLSPGGARAPRGATIRCQNPLDSPAKSFDGGAVARQERFRICRLLSRFHTGFCPAVSSKPVSSWTLQRNCDMAGQRGAALLLLAALALPSSRAWIAPALTGVVTGAALRRPATTGLGVGRSRARGVQPARGLSMGESDKPAVEMSEELMLMLAMAERKKLAVPEGGKVLVFGALGEIPQKSSALPRLRGSVRGMGLSGARAARQRVRAGQSPARVVDVEHCMRMTSYETH